MRLVGLLVIEAQIHLSGLCVRDFLIKVLNVSLLHVEQVLNILDSRTWRLNAAVPFYQRSRRNPTSQGALTSPSPTFALIRTFKTAGQILLFLWGGGGQVQTPFPFSLLPSVLIRGSNRGSRENFVLVRDKTELKIISLSYDSTSTHSFDPLVLQSN